MLVSEGGQTLDDRQLPAIDDLFRGPFAGTAETCAAGRRMTTPVLAAEQTGGQREVGHERDPERRAGGEHLALGLVMQQAVLVLHAGKAAQAAAAGRRAASLSCEALKFEQPISRTLPRSIRRFRAASVSAIGVCGSGLWSR